METLLIRVARYAKLKYAGLVYDKKDFYETHILHVVEQLRYYGGRDDVTENEVAAAFLHDVIEDTDATYEDIVLLFGEDIAGIVSRLTDKAGKNRLERHLNTYYILRRCDSAIKVKLADRISNMERSIGNKYASVYVKEYMNFKFCLYDGNNISMWIKLDELYEECKKGIKKK